MTQSSAHTTVLDLTNEAKLGQVGKEAILQKGLQDECIKMMSQSVKGKMDNLKTGNITVDSGQNVFFVGGTRGAGKTVFIQSVLHKLKEDTETKLYPLDMIDPTKFHSPMGTLVSVISLLNNEVEKSRRNTWCKGDNKHKDWQDALDRMAAGIRTYNGKDELAGQTNDILRMSQGIEYSFGSLTLSQQCHELFDVACEQLGCDAFVLAFDDIDTNFDTGWELLETMRRQLTSPRIVCLVTGDMQLYTHLVRSKQISNYPDQTLRFDENRKTERHNMIDHLEQQYLLKMFPVDKRVALKTMKQLVDERPILISGWSEEAESTKLDAAVREMIKNGLSLPDIDRSYTNEYIQFLMQLPMRLIFQILYRYNLEIRKQRQSPEALSNSLNMSMTTSLYNLGIDVNDLLISKSSATTGAIFEYALHYDDLDTAYSLRPTSNQEAIQQVGFTLAANIAHSLHGSISNLLIYVLLGPCNITLWNRVNHLHPQITADTLRAFKKYMFIGRQTSLRNWAARVTSCIGNWHSGVIPGAVMLNIRKPDRTKSETQYAVFQTDKEKNLAKVAILCSLSEMIDSQTRRYVSVFNLLAAISSILTAPNDQAGILNALTKSTAILSVQSPVWVRPEGIDTTGEPEELILKEEEKKWDALLIQEWKNSTAKLVSATSALLASELWSRIYNNWENIAQEHWVRVGKTEEIAKITVGRHSNAAKIMRLNIIGLLNAVLIEENRLFCSTKIDIDNKPLLHPYSTRANPVTSSSIFASQLDLLSDIPKEELYEKLKQRTPLFFTLASSPLFIPFLFAKSSRTLSATERRADARIVNFLINNIYEPMYDDLLPDHSKSEAAKDTAYKNTFGLQEFFKSYIVNAPRADKKPDPKKEDKSAKPKVKSEDNSSKESDTSENEQQS